ncbi:olfactory receptor 10K2-like [Paroedura picta]|uniref:olfactory receptor 10K2-like n=1 Tax=Paroedura picta TaxID=143630 RepID=UPI001015B31B
MERENHTVVREFVLVGFSNFPGLRIVLFISFFLIYSTSLAANILLITTIRLDRTLHIPMYFFLSILSCSELCYSFVVIPKMLVNLMSERQTISWAGCLCQMFFFNLFGGANCLLLLVMSYDRFVAICKPLRYPVLMKESVCKQLVMSVYASSVTAAVIEISFILNLPFCGPNRIHHFFCEMAPVLRLSCQKSSATEISIFLICVVVIFLSFCLILLSYSLILHAIFLIPSTEGKRKAFSTCTSHIIVVVVHFGCASVVYLRPKSTYLLHKDIFISVSYTVLTPLLNPVVYSLRNKDVQIALRNILGRSIFMKAGRGEATF